MVLSLHHTVPVLKGGAAHLELGRSCADVILPGFRAILQLSVPLVEQEVVVRPFVLRQVFESTSPLV